MQSEGNSFCRDVVLNIFNMAYRDKDSILTEKYEKQIFWELVMKIMKLLKKMLICKKYSTEAKRIDKIGFYYYFARMLFRLIFKNLNPHNNNHKHICFDIFGFKCGLQWMPC